MGLSGMLDPAVKHILLVEDDVGFQRIFQRVFAMLEGAWQIHAVEDGAGALKALQASTHSFSLALVDIGLPDMSGIDVIAAAHRRFAGLPILVNTAFSDEDTFLSAIRAGARGYLLKGDAEMMLRDSIRRVLQGENLVSPSFVKILFRTAGAPPALNSPNRFHLSPRELALLQYIANGNSYAECATVMKITLSTVQTHIRNMYSKLEVRNQRQCIRKARSSGFLKY